MDEENSVELHDDVAEGHDMKNAEAQSVAATDKAGDATKQAPARKGDKRNSEPMPKTKGAMLAAAYGKLSGMKKVDLAASYGAIMGEDVDLSDDDLVAEDVDDFVSDELGALVDSEATLSEEFKEKTAVIFEAALASKLAEEVERIESAYEEKLAEDTAAQSEELVEKVDSYLNYVVENWMAENEIAIQSGLRAEIAENFMEGLKGLFVESYIEVPESKVDLVDDLADQVEELEEALNTTTEDAIELSEAVELLQRELVVSEAVTDLADTQVEKFEELVEGVDFEDVEQFASKVEIIKESFFAKSVEVTEEVVEEDEAVALSEETSPSMDRYVTAIRKTTQK